jgi:hypothetical protein
MMGGELLLFDSARGLSQGIPPHCGGREPLHEGT